MKQIQLNYIVDAGLQNPTLLAPKVAAIPVDQELVFLNLDKIGDVTTPGAGLVTRTVTLRTNAVSDAMFPTSIELVAATASLLSGVIALQAPARVTAIGPIVS